MNHDQLRAALDALTARETAAQAAARERGEREASFLVSIKAAWLDAWRKYLAAREAAVLLPIAEVSGPLQRAEAAVAAMEQLAHGGTPC